MTLPTSGPISIADLKAEFDGPNGLSSYYRGGGVVPNTAANANVPTSGLISLGHFYGASAVTPGVWDSGMPGTYSVPVGRYNWLRVRCWGAGGGAAVGTYWDTTSGGASSVQGPMGGLAYAGGGTGAGQSPFGVPPAGGTASWGNVQNLNGQAASDKQGRGYGYADGGDCPNGGAGGLGGTSGLNGGWPGGGGGSLNFSSAGGGGGAFSHYYTTTPGGPFTLTAVVGLQGYGSWSPAGYSGHGAHGRVLIEWG